MDNFFKVSQITSVLSLHAPVVFKLFGLPVEENINTIASLKPITNSENCTESRIRILLRLTISVIGWFSSRDHLALDKGKVGLNIHVMWAVYGTNFRITDGFRIMFYSNKRLSECRNNHFEEGYRKDFCVF